MNVIIIKDRFINGHYGRKEYALVATDDGTPDGGPTLATFASHQECLAACTVLGWTIVEDDFATPDTPAQRAATREASAAVQTRDEKKYPSPIDDPAINPHAGEGGCPTGGASHAHRPSTRQ